MGRFDDRATQPARGPSDIFRWRVLDRIRGKAPAREPDHGVGAPVRDNDGALVRDLASSLTWIGHASFLLRMGGLYVTIDPIWSERIQGVVKRLARPGVALELVPKIDVVLVSHNHYDHLDLPTLKRIGPGALYVVPLGMASVLKGAGLTHGVELDWWQRHTVGELEVTLVPARLPDDLEAEAKSVALAAARALGVTGLLTTELFVGRSARRRPGEVRVFTNEFAPRPHNSGHVTRKACTVSQFEALARILLGVPLVPPRLVGPGAFCMANLLGEVWEAQGAAEALDLGAWEGNPALLEVVLYGKSGVATKRKMGHLVARGADAEAAISAARAFRAALAGSGPSRSV